MNRLGVYTYNHIFYTGTKAQPDVCSVFIKWKEPPLQVYHMHSWANVLDCFPLVSSFTAIARVVNSVKIFSNELSQATFQRQDPHLYQCWNAFKNFMRAMLAFIPVAGNLTLVLVDAVRDAVMVEPKIAASLENQQDIAGVALDGEVIFTINGERLRELYPSDMQSDQLLKRVTSLCVELLKSASKKGSQEEMDQLLSRFGRFFLHRK